MRYVSFIHRGGDSGYGISFPDFPGCVSVGDTVDDAVGHGCEALAFHVEGLRDDGESVPQPRSIEEIKRDPDLADWRRGADIVSCHFFWKRFLATRQHFPGPRTTGGHRRRSPLSPDDPVSLPRQRRAAGARNHLSRPRSIRLLWHRFLAHRVAANADSTRAPLPRHRGVWRADCAARR